MNTHHILFALYSLFEREALIMSDSETEVEFSRGFAEFVSGLDPYLWTDGKTADPSISNKFLEFVKSGYNKEEFSVEESYNLAKGFIAKFSEEKGISDITEIFEKCSFRCWEQICETVTSNETKKYKCACCGCYTMEEPSGSFEICPVCFWEDDKTQNNDPEYTGGANKVCLNEARKNYDIFGACTESAVPFVRIPSLEEVSGIVRELTDADFI